MFILGIGGVVGLLIIAGVITGMLSISLLDNKEENEHQLVLSKIEETGNLELVHYNFNDIAEESVKRKLLNIDNLAPDSKVLFIINGEAAACINLKDVKSGDIHVGRDKIIIYLPGPELCYAKINHENSKVYDANLTARVLNPELIDKGYKDAEKNIREKAISMGIYEQAKQNAEKLVNALLSSVTDKEIELKFRE